MSSDLVLSETVTLIRRDMGPSAAVNFGRDLLAGKSGVLVRTEEENLRSAFDLIERYREQRLSLADAASFSTIRRLDIRRVASFDQHFRIVLTEREVLS